MYLMARKKQVIVPHGQKETSIEKEQVLWSKSNKLLYFWSRRNKLLSCLVVEKKQVIVPYGRKETRI